MKFSKLYLSKLNNEYLFGFGHSLITMVLNVLTALNSLSQEIYARLNTKVGEMGSVLLKQMGSAYTKEVVEADAARDDEHNRIKRFIRFYLHDQDAVIQKAAAALELFMKPYWDIPEKAMDVQTAVTNEMLTKYKADATLVANAAIISIDKNFTNLETLNTAFDTVYKTRNTDTVAKSTPSATNLRGDVEMLIADFCNHLELEATYAPTDQVTQLFGEVDALRKKYNALIDSPVTEPEETTE